MLRTEPTAAGSNVLPRRNGTRIPKLELEPAVLGILEKYVTSVIVSDAESAINEVNTGRFPMSLLESMEEEGIFIDSPEGTLTEASTVGAISTYLWVTKGLSVRLPTPMPGVEYSARDQYALGRLIYMRAIMWVVNHLASLQDGHDFGAAFNPHAPEQRFPDLTNDVHVSPSGWGNLGRILELLGDVAQLRDGNMSEYGILVPAGSPFLHALRKDPSYGTISGDGNSSVTVAKYNGMAVFGVNDVNRHGNLNSNPVMFTGRVNRKTLESVNVFVPTKVGSNASGSADSFMSSMTFSGNEIVKSLTGVILRFMNAMAKNTTITLPNISRPAATAGGTPTSVDPRRVGYQSLKDVTIAAALAAGLFTRAEWNAYKAIHNINLADASPLEDLNIIAHGFPGGVMVVIPSMVTTYAATVFRRLVLGALVGNVNSQTVDYVRNYGVAGSFVLGTSMRPIVVRNAVIGSVIRNDQGPKFVPASIYNPVDAESGNEPMVAFVDGMFRTEDKDDKTRIGIEITHTIRNSIATAVLGKSNMVNATPIGLPASVDIVPCDRANTYLDRTVIQRGAFENMVI